MSVFAFYSQASDAHQCKRAINEVVHGEKGGNVRESPARSDEIGLNRVDENGAEHIGGILRHLVHSTRINEAG